MLKKIVLMFMLVFFAATSVMSGEPEVLDDIIGEHPYETNPEALKLWKNFNNEINNVWGFASREMSYVYGPIAGKSECKNNKSWIIVAMGGQPNKANRGLMHIDAICYGKKIRGDFNYVDDCNSDNRITGHEKFGSEIKLSFAGKLEIDDKSVEGGASVDFKWKASFDKPEELSHGKAVFFQMSGITNVKNLITLKNNDTFINLGDWNPKTMMWIPRQ